VLTAAHETADIWKGINIDLLQQREQIEALVEENKDINAWIDKATGNVAHIERSIYMKKVILFILIGLLAALFVLLFVMRLIG